MALGNPDKTNTNGSSTDNSDREYTATHAPQGVIVYCLFAGLLAVLSILLGVAAVASPELPTGAGFISIVFGTLKLVIIYGLLDRQAWGWRLAMVWFLVHIPFMLGTGNVLGFIIDLVMIGYLFKVRHLYVTE